MSPQGWRGGCTKKAIPAALCFEWRSGVAAPYAPAGVQEAAPCSTSHAAFGTGLRDWVTSRLPAMAFEVKGMNRTLCEAAIGCSGLMLVIAPAAYRMPSDCSGHTDEELHHGLCRAAPCILGIGVRRDHGSVFSGRDVGRRQRTMQLGARRLRARTMGTWGLLQCNQRTMPQWCHMHQQSRSLPSRWARPRRLLRGWQGDLPGWPHL